MWSVWKLLYELTDHIGLWLIERVHFGSVEFEHSPAKRRAHIFDFHVQRPYFNYLVHHVIWSWVSKCKLKFLWTIRLTKPMNECLRSDIFPFALFHCTFVDRRRWFLRYFLPEIFSHDESIILFDTTFNLAFSRVKKFIQSASSSISIMVFLITLTSFAISSTGIIDWVQWRSSFAIEDFLPIIHTSRLYRTKLNFNSKSGRHFLLTLFWNGSLILNTALVHYRNGKWCVLDDLLKYLST